MTKPFSIFPVLALVALALLAAGCGGSSDAESTLTKAEFIKKADSLCAKADEREAGEYAAWSRQNAEKYGPGELQKGLEVALLKFLVPSIREQVEEIKALGPPEEGEEQLEKYFDEVEVAVQKMEEKPLSVQLSRTQSPFFGSYKLGRAYGFAACSEIY